MVRTFSDDKKIYSVDMMIAYVNIFKPEYIDVDIADLIKVLEYDGWGDPSAGIKYSAKDVLNNPKKYSKDYNLIEKADLAYPIIMAHGFVDGVHRLTKSYLQKEKQIKAYIFDVYLFEKFLLDGTENWDKIDKINAFELIELFHQRFGNTSDDCRPEYETLMSYANKDKTGLLKDKKENRVGFQITLSDDYSRMTTYMLKEWVKSGDLAVKPVSPERLAIILNYAKNIGL
jgi:hypothetical protein